MVGSGLLRARLNQLHGVAILMQDVVGPAQLQHHPEIHRVGLVGDAQVLQRVFHIAGLQAFLGQRFGLNRYLRLRGVSVGRRSVWGSFERGADPVGEFAVIRLEHLVEQGLGADAFVAVQAQESELGGGEQIARARMVDDTELLLGSSRLPISSSR